MPELPEVEIAARRIGAAVAGARVESSLAPGMVTMKTFEPPLEALAQTTIEAIHFKDYVLCYCPQEQTGGRVLKDRRLSRLLK